MFKITVLRGVFAFRRAQVTGDRRRLYNEDLHNFYSEPNINWVSQSRIRRTIPVAHVLEKRNMDRILVGKLIRMRLFVRTVFR